MIELWTDGSAEPNPGPGGYAVLEVVNDTAAPVALGKESHTTNIRMEGYALRDAMKYAQEHNDSVEIHTDSEFWVNVLTKWAPTWAKNSWTKRSGPIKNLQLVQELYKLYNTTDTTLIWVRGHVGTEYNELADYWANEARKGATL
ncbi:ribonuclease HI [Candidatus Saccharibacteria bacterium]|nr:ribonuclease HI [Candidatus Saccharibacteria bacterium]